MERAPSRVMKVVSAVWIVPAVYLLIDEAVKLPQPSLPGFFWGYTVYIFAGAALALASGILAWCGYLIGRIGIALLGLALGGQQLSHLYYYGADYAWPQASTKVLIVCVGLLSAYLAAARAT